MQLALAHIGDRWLVSLYLPTECRFLDGPHTFASPLAALSYVRHWQALGAVVRFGSQAVEAALVEAAAAGAGVVRAVGD